MRLVDRSVTLVLAGAWHRAMLTPAWIAKYGLQLEGDVAVSIVSPIGAPIVELPTSYELDGVMYTVNPSSLILSPSSCSPDALGRVHKMAQAILRELPHTPIAAVGFNVWFETDTPSERLDEGFRQGQDDVVEAVPDEWTIDLSRIHTSFSYQGNKLNVDKVYSSDRVRLQFNFHQPASTAEGAVELLDRLTFEMAFNQAKVIASALSGEELRDDEQNSN